jgi:hypothetical protein
MQGLQDSRNSLFGKEESNEASCGTEMVLTFLLPKNKTLERWRCRNS